MDLKHSKQLILSHLGLVLAAVVPIATIFYQHASNKEIKVEAVEQSTKIGNVENESPTSVKRNRAPSFHRSEVIMETRKDSDTTAVRPQQGWISFGFEQPLVIAMVGLPARGKSYIVNMIIRYLKWIGIEARVFNVGSYRRKMGHQAAESNFFDANNEEGKRVREELAMAVQDTMYEWLHSSTGFKRRVAIFDATNTTIKRRQALTQRAREKGVELLFVESICNDQEVLTQNYNLKLQNDDYKGMDPETARKDFMDRVRAYEKVYEVIYTAETTLPWSKASFSSCAWFSRPHTLCAI